ncbi:MAG TPA: hypothetical protein VHN80_01780 [Kineosporiaceae bacterium]|nr:hypothetical protein [Kineosporiaceae bacterium]
MDTGRARPLRLLVFASTGTVLALGSHLLAGGSPPGWRVTLLCCLVMLAAAVGLSRRSRGVVEIGVVLGAVQLVLHELFMAGAGHVHHAAADDAAADAAWMPLAHTGAVLVMALLLARGERLLDLLLDWLRQVPSPRVPVIQPARFRAPARPTVAAAAVLLPAERLAVAPVVRRGPPARPC